MFDRESPMRCVFRFGTTLTRTVQKRKSLSDSAEDKKLNKMVDEVLSESMLDPSQMNFKHSSFVRESIEATIKLEKEESNQESNPFDDDLSSDKYIDIFSLRVLSLIVCRGKPMEKAKFLADLICHGNKEEEVKYNNKRLRRAMRYLLYFSSILPLKFLT